jgi:hypothetical protein
MSSINVLVKDSTSMSGWCETQIKIKFIRELLIRLERSMDPNEIKIIKDALTSNISSNVYAKKSTTSKKTIIKSTTNKTNDLKQKDATPPSANHNDKNMLSYVMRELKCNMPISTTLRLRVTLANEVLECMRKLPDNSFTEAREVVYKNNGIFITKTISVDDNRTDEHNMNVEREYDEYKGMIVYGWDDTGEVLYEPTFNARIPPPSFKESGPIWKAVLEERWEQKSYFEEDESLEAYTG